MQIEQRTPRPGATLSNCTVARDYSIAILAVGLIARLGLLWASAARFPNGSIFNKGLELGFLAQSIAAGQGLSSPFGGNTGPSAYLAPGYPMLIALIFRVFGTFTITSAIVVMSLQVTFSLVTLHLLMQIAKQIAGVQVANFAGLFWALSPLTIAMPLIFWETSLSTMLLAGMITLALRCQRQPGREMWIATGAYCALTTLVNPALLPTLIAIMAWIAWRTSNRIPRYRLAFAMLSFLIFYMPWPIRNEVALHAFIPLRSNMGFELWEGNRAGGDGTFQDSLHPYFNEVESAEYSKVGEVAYMQEKSSLARASVRAHPLEFVVVSLKRFARFWTGLGQASQDVAWVIVLHIVLTTVMGAAGITLLVKGDRARALLLCLPLIIFPLPYYITHADFRFRLVLDPLMTILAAYALASLCDAYRRAFGARNYRSQSRSAL